MKGRDDQNNDGPILKNAEAAKYIGMKPGTLNNKRANDEGPVPTYNGKSVGYHIRELDKYLAKNTGFKKAS